MEGVHQSRGVPDIRDVVNSYSADEQRSTTLRGMPALRLAPREAWKEPEDDLGDGVMNDVQNPRQNRRSVWLMRTTRFCAEASVVGLRYVANSTSSPLRRSVWLLLLLAGAAFTTFQIQNRIGYFLSRPVTVNLRIEHVEQMRFPTVTVCNENRIMYAAAEYLGNRPRKLFVFITGSIARSANLPVFSLLRGQF